MPLVKALALLDNCTCYTLVFEANVVPQVCNSGKLEGYTHGGGVPIYVGIFVLLMG